jgi:hypothetical protein
MTVSALVAFSLGQIFGVPLHGLWAVLTAVIVTQASVGGSISASLEYILGTTVGALYASAVALLIPHTTPLATAGVLALSIAPLAYAAGLGSAFRVAPFTAVIVLLAGHFHEGPITAAATRLLEVVLGGVPAVLVSLVLFPERARHRAKQAAVLALEELAHVLPLLLSGFSAKSDPDTVQRIQDGLGSIVASFETVVADERHEQSVGYGSKPSFGPLSRSLLRLRHDWVMIGRTAADPLPEALFPQLWPHISAIGSIVGDYLLATARALNTDQYPPSKEHVETVMHVYFCEVATIRAAGLSQSLSANRVEQLFALGFAFDQARNNLIDLERSVGDWNDRGWPASKLHK